MEKSAPSDSKFKLSQIEWDFGGAITAFLCALHCLLLPTLIILVPSIAASTGLIQVSEWVLFASAAIFVGLAGYRGFFGHHHNAMILVVLGVGIGMMAFGFKN